MAAATRAILERRGADWTTSIELVRAGVTNPSAAIAALRRAGVKIEEREVRRFAAWRLEQQLPLG